MARIPLKPLIPHIVLWCGAALLMIGLFVLVSIEQKKTRDIVRMQEVLDLRASLRLYSIDRASYPPSLIQPVNDTIIYTPLADNGIDPCLSSAGCPHFSIQFTLETDVLYPKGSHILTDQGIR